MRDDVKRMHASTLAYLGDAAYELAVLEMLVREGRIRVDQIHQEAVRYVAAGGQAFAVKALMAGFLTEEEIQVVKRARNHRITSKPRNADIREYKLATGFEALIGALYLSGEQERMDQVIAEAIRVIQEETRRNQ